MDLDEEDLSFLLALMQERFADLLRRSRDRILRTMQASEQRLAKGVDAMIEGLPHEDARLLQERVRTWLTQARTRREALEEQVFKPWRAFAQGRATAPGASERLRALARRELSEDARRTALRRFMPEVDATFIAEIQTWGQHYFAAARHACELLRGDLQVMTMQAQALGAGLETRTTPLDLEVSP